MHYANKLAASGSLIKRNFAVGCFTYLKIFMKIAKKLAMQITRKVSFYVLRLQKCNLFHKIKSYARSSSCKIANYLSWLLTKEDAHGASHKAPRCFSSTNFEGTENKNTLSAWSLEFLVAQITKSNHAESAFYWNSCSTAAALHTRTPQRNFAYRSFWFVSWMHANSLSIYKSFHKGREITKRSVSSLQT